MATYYLLITSLSTYALVLNFPSKLPLHSFGYLGTDLIANQLLRFPPLSTCQLHSGLQHRIILVRLCLCIVFSFILFINYTHTTASGAVPPRPSDGRPPLTRTTSRRETHACPLLHSTTLFSRINRDVHMPPYGTTPIFALVETGLCMNNRPDGRFPILGFFRTSKVSVKSVRPSAKQKQRRTSAMTILGLTGTSR